MQEKIILYSIELADFYKELKIMIEEAVNNKFSDRPILSPEFSDKTLLMPEEVCKILRISKATLYVWIKQGRIKNFKIRSRRYFAKSDIEQIIARM